VYVTVVGIFDSLGPAEKAKRALLDAGVLERRIDLKPDGDVYVIGVGAGSSFERERIRDLLLRNGASSTEQRSP
jgi:hypothetical protein